MTFAAKVLAAALVYGVPGALAYIAAIIAAKFGPLEEYKWPLGLPPICHTCAGCAVGAL